MTDERIGQFLATVRRHLGLRQADVARLADVDQKVVSLLERGHLDRVSVQKFRRVCRVLGIDAKIELRWRGGLVDRLIDRDHAAIGELVVAELSSLDWQTLPEFTFNVFGERGSVDILAWHAGLRALLIVEVKTQLTDLQRLLMSMSRKLRLVPGVAAKERGWDRAVLGHLVVVADTHANRSTVASHSSMFDASFPSRTAETRRWLRSPSTDLAGLWFVPRPPNASGALKAQRVHGRSGSGD